MSENKGSSLSTTFLLANPLLIVGGIIAALVLFGLTIGNVANYFLPIVSPIGTIGVILAAVVAFKRFDMRTMISVAFVISTIYLLYNVALQNQSPLCTTPIISIITCPLQGIAMSFTNILGIWVSSFIALYFWLFIGQTIRRVFE